MTAAASELEQAETKRCAALMAGDAETLAAMLDEGLVHIHLTGRVDDKAGYLAGFRDKYRFREVSRGPLNIRVWGETAVTVGPLTQTLLVRETGQEMAVRAITTQTWQRDGGRWLLTTCHNAPVSG